MGEPRYSQIEADAMLAAKKIAEYESYAYEITGRVNPGFESAEFAAESDGSDPLIKYRILIQRNLEIAAFSITLAGSLVDRGMQALCRYEVQSSPVFRDWTDTTYDTSKSHLVDYHFNSKGEPRNLFIVTSQLKAEKVVGTIHYWESRKPAPSMAVVDPELDIPTGTMHRLHEAASVRTGVGGNENSIVEFALKGMGQDNELVR
jgi:hypothetical protein